MTDDASIGAETQIVAWIEANVGPVRAIRRQERWRPSWYVEAKDGDREVKLYVRGARGGDWPPQPLAYEYRVHRVFEAAGLRVSHVYGFIEHLPAIVMESLSGRANLRTAQSEADRDAIRSQLVDQMVKMHSLDPSLLRAAGAIEPKDPVRRAMAYYDLAEQIYIRAKSGPQPQLEFLRKWMVRNPPKASASPEVVAIDAGQFMFEGDRLTGLIDFEMVGLGDRHTDLGALRTRDRAEYIGDLNSFYALYAQRAGIELDIGRIRYHGLAIAMLTPLMIASQLAQPALDQDYYLYLQWWGTNGKDGLEELAEIMGVELETWTAPVPGRQGRHDSAFEDMAMWLRAGAKGKDFAAYEMSRKLALNGFLRRSHAYQNDLEAEYLDEIAAVTGTRPTDFRQAETMLEAFVLAAGPEYDEMLLRLFYRQVQRHLFLVNDPAAPNPRFATRIPPLNA